jgi:FkbH-like protein
MPELIKLAKRAEKQKLYGEPQMRVAVLGTYSIQYICSCLKYVMFQKYGVTLGIFEGDYDGIGTALLDDRSDYYAYNPQATIILPNDVDVKNYPDLLSDTEDSLRQVVDYYRSLWAKAGAVFQANFVIPNIDPLGNLSANYSFSRSAFLRDLNARLLRERPDNVTFLDFDSLAANAGKNNWFDYTAYFTSKQGFNLEYLGDVCALIARQLAAVLGKTKKCLVLDLDNTLWGGVVGDDGVDGINLDPNDAVGEAYRFFQKYVLELKQRGVILAVCSKNDEATAREPFVRNSFMLLKEKDVSCFVANWNDKATNIVSIAKQLNIGTDSLVFFDDNPAEREIVRQNVPEALVVDVPEDPAYYAKALNDTGAFDWLQITKEDISRSASYSSNKARTELEMSFVDYGQYLATLEMEYQIALLDQIRVPRFTQLINKSNQFNLRTQRYSESQVVQMLNDSNHKLIYCELRDKFDDYGLISCVILHRNFIDTWVMSCRVLKRNVEHRMFEFIKSLGCSSIVGEYIPTAKNAIVKDLYPTLGFAGSKNKKGEWLWTRLAD